MPSITPSDHSSEEADALIARVAELQRCQQQEDAEGFISLFEPDAVWVTGGGKRLIGRDVIAEFTRQVLPGAMADGSVTYEVVHIAFIRNDIALTSVHQQYTDLAGNPDPEMVGAPSYIWSRRDGVWRIAAGQNTSVPQG